MNRIMVNTYWWRFLQLNSNENAHAGSDFKNL